jgi:hypothetical protein
MVRPSAFAVLRLITSSNFDGDGVSPGGMPGSAALSREGGSSPGGSNEMTQLAPEGALIRRQRAAALLLAALKPWVDTADSAFAVTPIEDDIRRASIRMTEGLEHCWLVSLHNYEMLRRAHPLTPSIAAHRVTSAPWGESAAPRRRPFEYPRPVATPSRPH